MEGLLHPVGPEDVRTYWIRRGGAMAVLVVLLIGVGFLVSSLGRTDANATAAETSAAPAVPEPAEAPVGQAPPPAPPAPVGNGAPNAVTDEEAVPIPSSARTAMAASQTAPRVGDRASENADRPRADAKPEPEPANTFFLTTEATPSATR